MKLLKTLAIAAVGIGLMAGPAVAGEENQDQGTTDQFDGGYFGFDLKNGKVAKISAALEYACQGGSGGIAYARTTGKLKVKNDKFEGKTEGDSIQVRRGSGPDSVTYTTTGKFVSAKKAKGTIKATLLFENGDKCKSGLVAWKAEKGAMID